MTRVSPEDLAEAFVEIADTLVDEFDLIEFLQMVALRAASVSSTRAAGLLLADRRGRLHLMAASDEHAEMLELFQVQADDGPCQDCYRTGAPVVNADLRHADETWPTFAPRAVAGGYLSVHAFPMRLRSQTIGALNLFGTDEGEMSGEDARIVQALADVATIGLLQERSLRQAEVLNEQLEGALKSRIVIEQAKGVLAQINNITPDEAFAKMRSYCRSRSRPLVEVARSVVTDSASIPELTRPAD